MKTEAENAFKVLAAKVGTARACQLIEQYAEPLDLFGEWELYVYETRADDIVEGMSDGEAFDYLSEEFADCIVMGDSDRVAYGKEEIERITREFA